MRSIYTIAGLAAITMVGAIGYGLFHGNLVSDARHIVEVPWGLVTAIDVYVGLFLFSSWILWRERGQWQGFLWVVLLLTLGNIATAAYVLNAAYRSKGDGMRFWLGHSAETRQR